MQRKTKRRILFAAIAAAAVLIAMGPCISRARFRARMVSAGFPPDYAKLLADLHAEHPRWIFEPLPVSDIPWSRIVERECTPSWNLVVKSAWAPEPWTKLGDANYSPYYAVNAKAYDSGAWLQASRAAVDNGWIAYPHQVGQTGQTVQADLYIACGISGQIQHLVGIQSCKTIVAIDVDDSTPMMKLADIAIKGDLFEVVPEIINELDKRRADNADHR